MQQSRVWDFDFGSLAANRSPWSCQGARWEPVGQSSEPLEITNVDLQQERRQPKRGLAQFFLAWRISPTGVAERHKEIQWNPSPSEATSNLDFIAAFAECDPVIIPKLLESAFPHL
jgi:hypothetical protein